MGIFSFFGGIKRGVWSIFGWFFSPTRESIVVESTPETPSTVVISRGTTSSEEVSPLVIAVNRGTTSLSVEAPVLPPQEVNSGELETSATPLLASGVAPLYVLSQEILLECLNLSFGGILNSITEYIV